MSKSSTNALMDLFFSTGDLIRELTAEEAEGIFLVKVKRLGNKPIAFGALHPEWRKLLEKMREGDQLWEFLHKSPDGTEFHGVKLLRQKRVVDTIIGSAKDPSSLRAE